MSNSLSTLSSSSKSSQKPDNRFTPYGSMQFNFNMDDFMMGFGFGAYDTDWKWSTTLSYDFRLIRKQVLVPKEGVKNTYYQAHERLHRIVINAHKDFPFISVGRLSIGPYIGAAGGLYWNSYKGISKLTSGFDVMPGAGLVFDINNKTVLRAGYEYWDTEAENIMPHRITFTVSAKLY